MKILIEVPDYIIEFCSTNKIPKKKVPALYKRYVEIQAKESFADPLDNFTDWFEQDGHEELDNL